MPLPEVINGWIVDTGTTYHLQSKASTRPQDLTPLPKKVPARSANGIIYLAHEMRHSIPSLGPAGNLATRPIDGTPNTLSLGRLILDHGCSFSWHPGQRPVLTLPDGKRLLLTIVRYAPYIDHESQHSLDDDEDPADAFPSSEENELEVERDMLTDDEVVVSGADSDVDFTTSADARECKVPARPMQKLPDGWSTPALDWAADVADTHAPGGAVVALPGSSDGTTPPDPNDGWSDAHWADTGETDDDEARGPATLGNKVQMAT